MLTFARPQAAGQLRYVRRGAALAAALLAICLGAAPAQAADATLVPGQPGMMLTDASVHKVGTGAWSYFGDPRAIYARGVTYIGWADAHGYTHVAALRDNRVIDHQVLLPKLSVDDHNNPALYLRPDGRLMIFYSAHNGDRLFYRISTNPYSIHSLSSVRAITTNTAGPRGFTYPNPLRLNGRLWMIFRGADWQPTYTISTSHGWSRARDLVRGPLANHPTKAPLGRGGRHRPYTKYDTDGKRIYGVFTEGNLGAYRNTIRFAEIDDKWIRKANGRRIARLGSAPLVTKLDLVRSYSGRGQWALDIAVGEDGRPVIVYQRRAPRVEYWYARFDGKRWRNHLITRYSRRARDPGAVGGITLDHETPGTVYLSRTADGSRSHEVEVWITPDKGTHWTHRKITHTPNVDDLRPVSPRGLVDFEQVIWFSGRRTFWTSFNTNVLAETLRRAWPNDKW